MKTHTTWEDDVAGSPRRQLIFSPSATSKVAVGTVQDRGEERRHPVGAEESSIYYGSM